MDTTSTNKIIIIEDEEKDREIDSNVAVGMEKRRTFVSSVRPITLPMGKFKKVVEKNTLAVKRKRVYHFEGLGRI